MTAREIVEAALGRLRTGYVFPDLAERAAAAIEVRLAAGEYERMDEAALADLPTSQLNDICADKHLRVRTMPPRAARPEPGEPAGQRRPRERRRPPHNYGIYRVERLEGNVGYLDLRGVADPEDAGPVIDAAMETAHRRGGLLVQLPAPRRRDPSTSSTPARVRPGSSGDLSSAAESRALAHQVYDIGWMDTVIHNAGVFLEPSRSATADGHPKTLAVNTLSPPTCSPR